MTEDCPRGDYGHCDCWYQNRDRGHCCHCSPPLVLSKGTLLERRDTPRKLALIGKTVILAADAAEGFEEEAMEVFDDFELWVPGRGFCRWLYGRIVGLDDISEVPYEQVKEVLGV